MRKKTKRLSKKKVQTFFACLFLALVGWPYFYFIDIAISLIVNLAINRAMLIEQEVTISFFELFF